MGWKGSPPSCGSNGNYIESDDECEFDYDWSVVEIVGIVYPILVILVVKSKIK